MGVPLIYEIVGSQEGEESADQPRSTLKFIVLNVDNRADVNDIVALAAPLFYRNLNLNTLHLSPQGGGVWYVDAVYTRYQSRIPGSLQIQFDIAGETSKLTHSILSVYYPAPNPDYDPDEEDGPDNEPTLDEIDFHGALGVSNTNGQIKVEGIDEFFPTFAFTITRVFGTDEFPLTTSFITAMYLATNTTNSVPVSILVQGITLNFDVGQLLFHGGTAQLGSDGHVEMVMKFAADPGLTNATIAGIPNVSKRGWDRLEVYYEESEDPDSNQLVPKPRQVNVNQTKYETDLNILFA